MHDLAIVRLTIFGPVYSNYKFSHNGLTNMRLYLRAFLYPHTFIHSVVPHASLHVFRRESEYLASPSSFSVPVGVAF